MRIALIGPAHPYKGGGARHTTELAHRLAAAGHDVVIESWRAQYPAWLYPGQQTVEVAEGEPYPRTRRSLSWWRPDGWLATGRRLRGFDLVAVVLLSPVQVPAYLGILAGLSRRASPRGALRSRPPRQAGPATVAICHNVLPHERRPGDVALTRALLRRTGAALTHSAEQAATARVLAPATRVAVARMPPHLPHSHAYTERERALPPATTRPGPPPGPAAAPRVESHPASHSCGCLTSAVLATPARHPHQTASGQTGLDRSGPGAGLHLLFFGIVRPYKGLDVLLHALARGPRGLTLTVAGEFWGGVAETKALIAELGLGDRVELRPGYVAADQIADLFARADALVLPYRAATASQNGWLAHAHGVPVIATRTGSLAEHVRDGIDGLTCEPADVDDLVRALERISAPGEAARLRSGIRELDPEPHWAAYLDVLCGLAPSARPGGRSRIRVLPRPDRRSS